MIASRLVCCAVLVASVASVSRHLLRIPHRIITDRDYKMGINLSLAVADIVDGVPLDRITLVYDQHVDDRFRRMMAMTLHQKGIMTKCYSIATEKLRDQFANHVKETKAKYEEMASVIFSSRRSAEDLVLTIRHSNLIQRNILYIFYWELWPPSDRFVDTILEAMRVAVISNPRPCTYRLHYSQANPQAVGNLILVNWWTCEAGLFRFPALPSASRTYSDLAGRTLQVPVLHKPPWNFVTYTNKTFLVEGGRDHELLAVLASKLHFKFQYFDPPERSQGSAYVESSNGQNRSFPGILGLISERQADLALGDVTVTYERSQAVEFSFLTLADSGAFVTHSPSRLNEALALVRPFQMEVWPVLVITMMMSGPVLFLVLEAPRLWRGKSWHVHRHQKGTQKKTRRQVTHSNLFWECVWYNTALFLKQSIREPLHTHRARLLTILLSFAATYVIGDMYSANLTSLLARPGRERPISTLEQLEEAMRFRGYQLLVEKHSSSYSILENGTGVYKKLWSLLQRQRAVGVVESGEDGMLRVRDEPNFAMLGGRETLYFDTRRFGAYNFHLSEKLYTRYSAIALQTGCPYIDSINRILMQLFEAGILTKMTEEEYEKLGDKLHSEPPPPPISPSTETPPNTPETGSGYYEPNYYYYEYSYENTYDTFASGEDDSQTEKPDQQEQQGHEKTKETTTPETPKEGPGEGDEPDVKKKTSSGDEKLKPISITMLQGAFYALLLGYALAAIALLAELIFKKLEGRVCSCTCLDHPCAFAVEKLSNMELWKRAREHAAQARARAQKHVVHMLQRVDTEYEDDEPPLARPFVQ